MRLLARGEGWAVVAKAPRLLVHRNAYAPSADAVPQQARNLLGTRVHLVNRLDFQASGCVVLATDPESCAILQRSMTSAGATKRYVALVRGQLRADAPITVANPMRDDAGVVREATTVITPLGACALPRCSLVLAEPLTGRFHQVRRHVRDLDHPIIGDTKHGDGAANREFRSFGIDRLALHAISVDIPLESGLRIAVDCPLFADQAAVYGTMPWWDEAVARVPALALPPIPLATEPSVSEVAA